MPVEIASGAGMEAIIFGTFGISMEKDKLTIEPKTNEDMGISTLRDFRFKGKLYNIRIDKTYFSVWLNDKKVAEKPFGESVVFE
jgi:cellobiose phosphorylase